jgi:hypothetical protein
MGPERIKERQYTYSDLYYLSLIYYGLESITIPKKLLTKCPDVGHSKRTGSWTQPLARQVSFGNTRWFGITKPSKYSTRFPEINDLLFKFIKSHAPEFEATMVYVNKNVVCKPHIDSNNNGTSILVGLGDYTGGSTILHMNPDKAHDISQASLEFDGSSITHSSSDFEGTRYSLVFFK